MDNKVSSKDLTEGQPGPAAEFHLFMPFYTPRDKTRADELLACLAKNLERSEFTSVCLMVDDDTAIEIPDPRLSVVRMPNRPTYQDWMTLSHERCPGQISILANSDIYFDQSIGKLADIFATDPSAFVALTRYDKSGQKLVPHRNPQWSQDMWAFRSTGQGVTTIETRMCVPLGIPRCDNKIAYLFSVSGYTVYNPFRFIKAIHLHETDLRYYSKKGDRTLVGGMAMVQPSETLTTPALLEIEVWSENTLHYNKISVNKSLERWALEPKGPDPKATPRPAAPNLSARPARPLSGIFGHDADWQYPAITEQHAYRMMVKFGQSLDMKPGTAYFGFPWATLFDLILHSTKSAEHIASLRAELERARAKLAGCTRIITVCQHIHIYKFQKIFADLGITDIYWAHCTKDQSTLPDYPGITLHPLPLFPVQKLEEHAICSFSDRAHLFSFVGAEATKIYLTNARTLILELLNDHPRGKIINRTNWHYNKIVYDKQILNRSARNAELVDEDASAEFRNVMAQSIFTLCPSGTGPNSIRLWEALASGSVPVVLADTYRYPGDDKLWRMATVSCAETPEAIAALSNRLELLAADPGLMAIKQQAMRLLTSKYGKDCFVYDIITQMRDG